MEINMTTYTAHDKYHSAIGDAGSLTGAVELIAGSVGNPASDLTTVACSPAEGVTWPDGRGVWNVYRTADLAVESADDSAEILGIVTADSSAVTIA